MTAPAPKAQLLELTSMRFFAAMAVLLGHFQAYLGMSPDVTKWFTGGYGVSFFFVLSGFILAYVYWEHFEGGVTRPAYRQYAVARFARIYPAYVLGLLLITFLFDFINWKWPGAFGYPPNPVTSWLMNLFALQTFSLSYATQQVWNGPSWSISTEFGFYILCPFILAIAASHLRSLGRLAALLAVTVVFAAAMQALALVLVFKYGLSQPFVVDVVASRNIFWRFPEFLTGVLAARMLYGGHLPWLANAAARNVLLAASLATIAFINAAPWPTEHVDVVVMRQFRLNVAYMLPFAALVLALAAGPTFASPLLKRPTWVFLGEISYGIYIYHWVPRTAFDFYLNHGVVPPPWLVTGVIAGTIMFSAASYLWYERPLRVFLRKKLGH